MTEPKYTTAYHTEYIVSNIGPNKDNYAIESSFKHDLITDVITVQYSLIKNWIHSEFNPKLKYKPGAKFRERIATDNYYKLLDILKDIVSKQDVVVTDIFTEKRIATIKLKTKAIK